MKHLEDMVTREKPWWFICNDIAIDNLRDHLIMSFLEKRLSSFLKQCWQQLGYLLVQSSWNCRL